MVGSGEGIGVDAGVGDWQAHCTATKIRDSIKKYVFMLLPS
jgi:hypothetical protein